MARIPRPTKLKILSGEPNKDRINQHEPQPPPGKTTCPSSLKGAARNEWNRIYPILDAMGIMTPADRAELAGYCIAWGTVVDVQKQINKIQDEAIKQGKDVSNSYLLKTSNGNIIISPLLSIRARALDQVNQFGAKFGLSPSDRGRINAPDQDKDLEDELDTFLNTGKMN